MHDETPDWFLHFPATYNIRARAVPIEEWESGYGKLIDLTKVLDKRKEFMPELSEKIRKIEELSGYDIRTGSVPPNIFLDNDDMKKLIGLSPDFLDQDAESEYA